MVAIAGDTTSRDSGIEEDRLTEADEALELVGQSTIMFVHNITFNTMYSETNKEKENK